MTIKVILEHWQWCHSIGHTRFPMSLPLQLCLYLAPFPTHYHLFPTRLWTHSLSGVIYHASTTTTVYQSAHEIWSVQLHQFQRYDWGKIKKRVMWPWPRPLGGSLSTQCQHLIYITYTQNVATLASTILQIWLRASKLKMVLVTLTTPLFGLVCHP